MYENACIYIVLHRLEVFVRFRLMGVKGKAEYKALSEERAVELGSEILGEAFLFSVAAGYMVYEYWRGVKKEQMKQDQQNLHISKLQTQTANLERRVAGLQQTMDSLRTELHVHSDTNQAQPSAAKPIARSWWSW